MSNTTKQSPWVSMATSLGWPLLIGSALSCVFYFLIHQGFISHPFVLRYFAGHPVEYLETAMFFVGLSALLLKLGIIFGEFIGLSQIDLGTFQPGKESITDIDSLVARLKQLPSRIHSHRLYHRLSTALGHIQVTGSANDLQDELKFLAEQEEERSYQSYALSRIVIWATPMLGFLGTVIGITLALGNLSPEALVNEPKTAMESLLGGLSIAFDTTALALTLSILLMFCQFLTERVENELLASVDSITNDQLKGRFEQVGSSNDPHVATIEHMAQRVLKTTEGLVGQQTKLWRETVEAAHGHWQNVIGQGKDQIQQSLKVALGESLKAHAFELAKAEQQTVKDIQENWKKFEHVLIENARIMQKQQQEMTQQSEVMLKVVEATGKITSLEDTLNRNLQSLSGTHNFEDTVMSLAAAIHLLNTKLGQVTQSPSIDLQSKPSSGQAA